MRERAIDAAIQGVRSGKMQPSPQRAGPVPKSAASRAPADEQAADGRLALGLDRQQERRARIPSTAPRRR